MKGFTLVEVLGILVILGVVALVVIPVTTNLLKENKQKLYNIQISNIEEGARCFMAKHSFDITIENGSKLGIKLSDIKNATCLDSSIINPKTNEEFSNDLEIQVTNNDNNYEYQICDDDVTCNVIPLYGE